VLYCRKILSADTESARQDSARDEAAEEDGKQDHVSQGDNICSASTNSSSQNCDDSDTCVISAAAEHLPKSETTTSDTRDNMPEAMETSDSVFKTDVDSVSGDNIKSDTADDTQNAAQCADVSAVQSKVSGDNLKSDTADDTQNATQCADVSAVQSKVSESADVVQSSLTDTTCSNTDIVAQSLAVVCDHDEHRTESCGEAKLEQTDCAVSDEGRDKLPSKEPCPSLHSDTNDKCSTESATDVLPDLSPALLKEVNGHYLLLNGF